MTESGVVRACLEYLAFKKIFAWRANSGAVTGEYKGKKRFVRFAGVKGLADIIGVLPDGRFLAVECKAGRNKLSQAQEEFLARVKKNGGVSVVVYNADDLVLALKGLEPACE